MEGSSSNQFDKMRVLDIKPLRTLKPVFPNGNQTPPFVCMPPFGPVPQGFTPFYPFSSPQANQNTPNLNQVHNPPQQQPLNQPQHQPQPQHQRLNPQQYQPLNQPQHQPLNPQQHESLNQPQYQPQPQSQRLNPQQYQPLNQSQHQPLNPQQHQPLNQPQHQPRPQSQRLNPQQYQPLNQPQHQPLNPQQHEPLNQPQHQPQPQRQRLNPQQHQPLNQPQHQPLNQPRHQLQPLYSQQHQPLNPQQYQPLYPQQHHSQVSLESLLVPSLSSSVTTSNGDMEPEGSSLKRKQRNPRKKRTPVKILNYESGISVAQRDDGDRELVKDVLIRFDALRRRFFQLEDVREEVIGIIKRPDMKAGAICMSSGVRTNTRKRLGIVPGVEIGDIFYFRFEMCLAGLHSQSMAGIDYLVFKRETEEEPLATSIVSSGFYDNDTATPDVLIYTGEGGKPDKDKQVSDQKLEKGNLALERSLHRNSVVRVIRGLQNNSHDIKIYMYDGLYEIKESWRETGKSGQNIFKFKLFRVPGQPPAFAIWTAVQMWKKGSSPREGFIHPDISAGVESIPVSLVNDVDTVNGPAYFSYSSTVKYSESFRLVQPSVGCDCGNLCKPGNLNCQCLRKNGGDFPYTTYGVLVSRKPMIYECSPSCPCITCKNKVTQMGLKVKLEIFKTPNRGWGLRSWDPIRAGSFICIYAGEAKDKSRVQQTMANDDYTFDTTRIYTPFTWNYEASLAGEDSSNEITEEFQIPLPLIISAKNTGNVARFMNHSCSPNVFWQPVTYENNGLLCLQVAFFAISHISPMTELTYDYGVSQPNGSQNGNPLHEKKTCLCGSISCRGSFG